jgi:hypothetical protein
MSFQYTNDNKILYISGTFDQPLNDIEKIVEEIIFLTDYGFFWNYECTECRNVNEIFRNNYCNSGDVYDYNNYGNYCNNIYINDNYYYSNGCRDCAQSWPGSDFDAISLFNQPLYKEDLPSSLTRLTLSDEFNQLFDEGILPKKLTYLSLGKSFCQLLNNLPESVLELEIHSCYKYINNLPHFIEKITILFDTDDTHNKIITNLPMSIKHIKINIKEKLHFIKKIPFGCLITDLIDNEIIQKINKIFLIYFFNKIFQD